MESKIFYKIHELIRTLCVITLTAGAVYLVWHYAKQEGEESMAAQDLKSYYANNLTDLYIKCYEVDMDGRLMLTQYEFKKAREILRNQMLKDGFNRACIEKMEDDARKIGQQQRRAWDKRSRE